MHTTSPFIVNAMELAASPQDFEVDVAADELDLSDENLTFTEHVTGRLAWRWIHDQAVATGRLSSKAKTTCARCLGEAEIEVAAEIYLVFTDEPPTKSDPLDLGEEDDEGLVHYSGDKIDAREEIRAALLIEAPDFPVCSESCKGLCPHCGADLNTEPCSCEQGSADCSNDNDASKKSASWRDQIDKLRNLLD